MAVCLERNQGPLVSAWRPETCLVRCPVHPLPLAQYRDTFTPSHATDDPTAAARPRELRRTPRDKLQPLTPPSPAMRASAPPLPAWCKLWSASSTSPGKPSPPSTTPWRHRPRVLPPAPCVTPCQALAPSWRPASAPPSAHHATATPQLMRSQQTPGWRRGPHAAAAHPGSTGAGRARHACDKPSSSGLPKPVATPAGPVPPISSSATRGPHIRLPSGPSRSTGAACSAGVGSIARPTMNRSISPPCTAVARPFCITWRMVLAKNRARPLTVPLSACVRPRM